MNRRSFIAALPLVPAALKAAQAKPKLNHGSCSISMRGADSYMHGVKKVCYSKLKRIQDSISIYDSRRSPWLSLVDRS